MTRKEKIILVSVVSFILIVIFAGAIFSFSSGEKQQVAQQSIEYIRPIQLSPDSETPIDESIQKEEIVTEEQLPVEEEHPLTLIYGAEELAGLPPSPSSEVSTKDAEVPATQDTQKAAEEEPPAVVAALSKEPAPAVSERSTTPEVSRLTHYRSPAPVPQVPQWYYWIQLVSSGHQDTVVRGRALLRRIHMDAVVEVVYVRDERYYRLRVGPFPVKEEAQKFLNWLLQLEDFTEGYVIRKSSG